MDRIKEHFSTKIPIAQAETKAFLATHGEETLGEIKVNQIYQGMRGMLALICETSKLDPEEGIRFRGYSIPELP
ncbi:MAG TPA: type I citrate synthase, partial [Cryomorphaceae bacterium]|nr:type I citrate synthase [Cryomorphaceae bacterium]